MEEEEEVNLAETTDKAVCVLSGITQYNVSVSSVYFFNHFFTVLSSGKHFYFFTFVFV